MKIYSNYSMPKAYAVKNIKIKKQDNSIENVNENLSFKGLKEGVSLGFVGALVGFGLGGPIGAAIAGTLAGAAGGSAKKGEDCDDINLDDIDRAADYTMNDFPTHDL